MNWLEIIGLDFLITLGIVAIIGIAIWVQVWKVEKTIRKQEGFGDE